MQPSRFHRAADAFIITFWSSLEPNTRHWIAGASIILVVMVGGIGLISWNEARGLDADRHEPGISARASEPMTPARPKLQDRCAEIGEIAFAIAHRRDEGTDIGLVKFQARRQILGESTQRLVIMLIDGIYYDETSWPPEKVRNAAVADCQRGARSLRTPLRGRVDMP